MRTLPRSKHTEHFQTMKKTESKPPWQNVQWTSNAGFFRTPVQTPPVGPWVEEVEESLFALKERIQPFDKTELWDLAKRITNPYERIHTQSSRLYLPPSICLLTPLSRSFFKMIEILQVTQFFERFSKVSKLRSLHLCEGPGGFIEAFLYKANEVHKLVQVSYGITLRSTHQIIPGWRRATPFLQKNPNVKLIYGPTTTGDIYEPENQNYLAELCSTQKMHLVTADGGFDFSDDFHAQEKMIFRLLVCSSIIALQTLATDGDFVLKLFDIQSQVTRDFITLLGSCFKSWTLYKPVTSRPCNSEWYFLGKSALLHRTPILQQFIYYRDKLAEGHTFTKLLDGDNPKEDYLQNLQKERMVRQSIALQEVLTYCETTDREPLRVPLWDAQIQPSRQWCEVFRMPMRTTTI
jgi:23S rRNA U2552 (ribose-2'-O)-methylase RlmE/FtsJ